LPADIKSKVNEATAEAFGEKAEPVYVGVGGSIPFMEVFMREFPGTNFMLTGCCFADSNAHAPNENLDLKFCAKLTTTIALLLSKI
jgi:acetylornithine deacetylase/succinyl-diaminopimelate desuccinylase-like protein